MGWSMWQWNTKTWAQNFNTQQQLLSQHNKAKCPNKAQATHEMFSLSVCNISCFLSLITHQLVEFMPPTNSETRTLYIFCIHINVRKKKKKAHWPAYRYCTICWPTPKSQKKMWTCPNSSHLLWTFHSNEMLWANFFFFSNDKDVRQTH